MQSHRAFDCSKNMVVSFLLLPTAASMVRLVRPIMQQVSSVFYKLHDRCVQQSSVWRVSRTRWRWRAKNTTSCPTRWCQRLDRVSRRQSCEQICNMVNTMVAVYRPQEMVDLLKVKDDLIKTAAVTV